MRTNTATSCPYCSCRASIVHESRPHSVRVGGVFKTITRRRRECLGCRCTFFTWEIPEDTEVDAKTPIENRVPQ